MVLYENVPIVQSKFQIGRQIFCKLSHGVREYNWGTLPVEAVQNIAQGRTRRHLLALQGFARAPCASPSAPPPRPPAPEPPIEPLTQQQPTPPTCAPTPRTAHPHPSPSLQRAQLCLFPLGCPCAIFFPALALAAAAAVAGTRRMLSGLHRWAAADTPHAGTTHPHPHHHTPTRQAVQPRHATMS